MSQKREQMILSDNMWSGLNFYVTEKRQINPQWY